MPRAFDRPLREFLTYCRIECGFAPATLEAYERDIRDLAHWMLAIGAGSWRDLSLERITGHLRDLAAAELAATSIVRHVASIRVFARFLHATDHLDRNPAELLARPRTWQTLPGVIGPQQMQRLLDTPRPEDPLGLRDRAMLEMLYAGGLRASELADLDLDHVIMDLGVARVTGKGNKERIVPLGQPAMEAMQRYLDEQRWRLLRPGHPTNRLLLSRNGKPINRIVVWQIVTKHARRAGLRHVHPHTLRHCFATDLLAGGADLRVVQELLGHSDLSTTQIYTHVDRSKLKDVIARFHPRP